MAAQRIRVAVVGVGYWGPNLVRNLQDSQLFEVAHVCDVRPEALELIERRYPAVPRTTRFEDILADSSVDAVAIATPVSSHYALAMSALQAGKHTFVEKPLAGSSAEALALRDLAESNGLVLMPGHTFLYSPSVTTIKKILDSGELGDIYFISSSRVNLGQHQPDASVVWDLGPHDFSILRYWLDAAPEEVSALSRSCLLPNVPDVCFINLRYSSGTIAHVELSWLSPSKLRRTAIVGSKKMIVYDDTSNESVRIFDSGADIPDPETFGEYRLSYRTGDIISPRIDATEPLALELADFAAAIRSGATLASSAEVGLDVLRTIEAVDRSLEEGGVSVAVDGEGPSLTDQLRARIPRGALAPESGGPDEVTDGGESIGTAILGGGPAGLTAAYVLAQRGRPGVVFEADGSVGGIAKTIEFNGFRFDLGGHRFFTKLKPVQRLWEEMLGEEFLVRPRLSRIYYNGKYFNYPITAKDVVGRLGLIESARCALSYLWAARRRNVVEETFEQWVTARFGRRLYDTFFRTYTEKLWGIPGSEIRSLWAAQRIKNFSLGKAIMAVLGLRREHVTTLIERFHYPRLGPGQMWEGFSDHVRARGIPIHLNERCISIKHVDNHVTGVVLRQNGTVSEYNVDAVLSSIPLSELILNLDPPPPPEVVAAARSLRYRDLVLVALMLDDAEPFPDNWIYLHDPETRAGRVQNYGAWSAGMVQPGTTCLGVEYFCFRGDEIWELPGNEAVKLATKELADIGLIDPATVVDGVKVLVPKAYPMYDVNYEGAVATIRAYLEGFANLQTCGRNGLHRYNNQDHSMWTAMLAMSNLLDGARHDVWDVNTDDEYHEEGRMIDGLITVGADTVDAIDLIPSPQAS